MRKRRKSLHPSRPCHLHHQPRLKSPSPYPAHHCSLPPSTISQLFTPITALLLLSLAQLGSSVILTGAPDSFARYPKWSMSYENELSFELRTRQPDALLLYVDDGGVNANFLCLSLVEGRLQLELRTGEASQEMPLLARVLSGGGGAERRGLLQSRVDSVRLDDGRWHKFSLFQAWENVKLTVDEEVMGFSIF